MGVCIKKIKSATKLEEQLRILKLEYTVPENIKMRAKSPTLRVCPYSDFRLGRYTLIEPTCTYLFLQLLINLFCIRSPWG